MGGLAQIEAADTADEQIADGEVEKLSLIHISTQIRPWKYRFLPMICLGATSKT